MSDIDGEIRRRIVSWPCLVKQHDRWARFHRFLNVAYTTVFETFLLKSARLHRVLPDHSTPRDWRESVKFPPVGRDFSHDISRFRISPACTHSHASPRIPSYDSERSVITRACERLVHPLYLRYLPKLRPRAIPSVLPDHRRPPQR